MPPTYNDTDIQKGDCMKGSVGKSKGQWYVSWYDPATKRDAKIYRHNGFKLESRRMAHKLLLAMQTDVEKGIFYLGKYKKKGFGDVTPFLQDWIENLAGVSKSTEQTYKCHVKNHIQPFFEKHHQLTLSDIHIDVLRRLRKDLEGKGLAPKTQHTILTCLRAVLQTAWESRRIQAIPPFPKKKEYSFIEKVIKWLPEDRQLNVINQIPEEHRPIFYFLKYSYRRPAEAMALHKKDYSDGVFTIRRSISAKELTNRTKTGAIHTVPCDPRLEPYIKVERAKQIKAGVISKFFFVYPKGRSKGKRYTSYFLARLWKDACKKAGENIDLYSGLKHSSCSQFINERGGSESELQILTDHARLESVRNYAKTEVKRKRELMLKNVVNFDDSREAK